MESLQLQQALVDAGMPTAGTGAAKSFLQGLSNRLGLGSSAGGLKQQFFDLLTHLLGKAPSLACSWLADYLAFSTTLVSSDPEEAYILQPQSVLAWCQHAAAGLRQRVEEFLRTGPSARVNSVLELQQTAQSLLAVATAVKAVSSTGSSEVKHLIASLTQLQQATKVLQVLEQLQQQQLGSPTRLPHNSDTPNGTPAGHGTPASSSSTGTHFGQQPLFRPRNTALAEWQQQLQQRRAVSPGGHLFLDDILAQLQQQARSPSDSPALMYPYQDVLTCISSLFVGSSSSSSREAWHAKLAVLLYFLLDGGWLSCAEPFAQGFQLPLTMVQQWQCHHLLDASAGISSSSRGNSAALDKACQLLGAIACPTTPFRFVEELLQVGRPATALAVQRARCAGSGASSSSSSLNEAEVLLRVQLGGGLLAEAFCDLRRHFNQVPVSDRTTHTNTLMRQLVESALSSNALTTAAAAAAATASRLGQQLQLHDHTAATAKGVLDASSIAGGSRARQQQLLQLPLDSSEEAVLVAVLRERMSAGKTGGHLLPLYLLQRGRTLEALDAYADYRASPAASGTVSSNSSSGQGRDAAANEADAEAASRALLHKRLDAVMAAAAAALPPALRAAATVAGSGSSGAARPVLQGLGASDARRLQGAGEGGMLLQHRGVEPPAFLAPLLYSPPGVVLGVSGAAAGAAGVGTPAARRGGAVSGVLAVGSAGGRSAESAGAAGRSGASRLAAPAALGVGGGVRPLLFEEELAAEAGLVMVRLGGKGAGDDATRDVVPLLFGTPAPAAAAVGAAAGRTPAVVRGGLFDTPGAGRALWGNATPVGAGVEGLEEFGGMSEADFERQVRFATPQPTKAAGAAAAGGVFTHTGRRQIKRMRM